MAKAESVLTLVQTRYRRVLCSRVPSFRTILLAVAGDGGEDLVYQRRHASRVLYAANLSTARPGFLKLSLELDSDLLFLLGELLARDVGPEGLLDLAGGLSEEDVDDQVFLVEVLADCLHLLV